MTISTFQSQEYPTDLFIGCISINWQWLPELRYLLSGVLQEQVAQVLQIM